MDEKLLQALEEAFAEPLFLERLSEEGAPGPGPDAQAWGQLLEPLLPTKERVRCADVVEQCRVLLEQEAQAPREGWLFYISRVAVSLAFPEEIDHTPAQRGAALTFLQALRVLLDRERQVLPFDSSRDFAFCTREELRGSDRREEYRTFLNAWRGDCVYETMRLSAETTPFSTLEHIAGVHHVAMTMARELRAAGGEVDLAMVSASAACHDIGKFGCRTGERVPYLHYYYTDQWCTRRNLPDVGHIAANHSTWDLELENLSAENLLLIYADFRVKQEKDDSGRERTHIYTLEQSYDVILSKLDNVDDAKRRRYAFVYAKLCDFQEYLQDLGVDVTLEGHPTAPVRRPDAALLSHEETVRAFRLLAVEHNLHLMHRFSHERLFANVLEAARSEKAWSRVRAYVSILEEYFTYLTAAQKAQSLSFLYELLMDREGDIRRQAAALIGRIIACFNAGYQKELPKTAAPSSAQQTQFALWARYLDLMIYPDHKLTDPQKSHIHYTMKITVQTVLTDCSRGRAPVHGGHPALLRHAGSQRPGGGPGADGYAVLPAAGAVRRGLGAADGVCRGAAGPERPGAAGGGHALFPPGGPGAAAGTSGGGPGRCSGPGAGLQRKSRPALSPGLYPAEPGGERRGPDGAAVPPGGGQRYLRGQPEKRHPLGAQGREHRASDRAGASGRAGEPAAHRRPLR